MPATRRPVRRLTVLYDAGCPLCTQLRGRLERRRRLVPLDLVPAGSERARELLPGLDHAATLDEITVVGDGGQVFRGTAAWITVLWALDGYRALAHRLATTTSGALLASTLANLPRPALTALHAAIARDPNAPAVAHLARKVADILS